MSSRSIIFADGEYYHIYNRGVDKRTVFLDQEDLSRFVKCLKVLNTKEPIGSLYEYSFTEKLQLGSKASKLVDIICFCLNPNHYHLLIKQKEENGVSKFMQRLGTAYSKYFNDKYKRSGTLFQGKFKAIHVDNNEYLLHLSAYINRNFEVHNKWQKEGNTTTYSSWDEYCGRGSDKLCQTKIILNQFLDINDYKNFVNESLMDIKKKKMEDNALSSYLLE